MKKIVKWVGIGLGLSACILIVFGVVWIRQYQTRLDEEPEIVLSPTYPDITYCTIDGVALKMDLYHPEPAQDFPQLVVYVHGGSFTGGDKRSGSGIIDIPAMTARGFAVAAVNYRLMPAHPFPAEVIDAKCAVRFLRAHAKEYGLRVANVGIWGGSAGGHLAAMVGLTNGKTGFEVGDYLDQSSQVDAVVEMFGPTDLTLPVDWLQRLMLRRAFGTDDPNSPLLRQASPIQYITVPTPPFLILHGEQDSAVPLEHAKVFYQKLTDAGVEVSLVTVKNANHNFKPTGGPIAPTRQEISEMMADFFDRWLK